MSCFNPCIYNKFDSLILSALHVGWIIIRFILGLFLPSVHSKIVLNLSCYLKLVFFLSWIILILLWATWLNSRFLPAPTSLRVCFKDRRTVYKVRSHIIIVICSMLVYWYDPYLYACMTVHDIAIATCNNECRTLTAELLRVYSMAVTIVLSTSLVFCMSGVLNYTGKPCTCQLNMVITWFELV